MHYRNWERRYVFTLVILWFSAIAFDRFSLISERYLSSTGEIAGRNLAIVKHTYMYTIKRLITNRNKSDVSNA